MSLSWIPEDSPFRFPEHLNDLFRKHTVAYGCDLSEFGAFTEASRVWRVARGAQVVGYAWLEDRREDTFEEGRLAGWWLGGATLPEFEGQGVFRFAMDQLEREAAGLGADAALVQVNSNDPQTGGRVRKALTLRGYSLLRSDEEMYARDPAFSHLGDAALIEDWPLSIVMRKAL